MAGYKMFKALCLRDCAQDAVDELGRDYCYYRAGQTYLIREDSPVLPHFRPVEQLDKKEGERVQEEEGITRPVSRRRK
jgi:hypothetical protein